MGLELTEQERELCRRTAAAADATTRACDAALAARGGDRDVYTEACADFCGALGRVGCLMERCQEVLAGRVAPGPDDEADADVAALVRAKRRLDAALDDAGPLMAGGRGRVPAGKIGVIGVKVGGGLDDVAAVLAEALGAEVIDVTPGSPRAADDADADADDCPCPTCRAARAADVAAAAAPDAGDAGPPAVPDSEVDEAVADIRRSSEIEAEHVARARRYMPGGTLWTRLTPAQRKRISAQWDASRDLVRRAVRGR